MEHSPPPVPRGRWSSLLRRGGALIPSFGWRQRCLALASFLWICITSLGVWLAPDSLQSLRTSDVALSCSVLLLWTGLSLSAYGLFFAKRLPSLYFFACQFALFPIIQWQLSASAHGYHYHASSAQELYLLDWICFTILHAAHAADIPDASRGSLFGYSTIRHATVLSGSILMAMYWYIGVFVLCAVRRFGFTMKRRLLPSALHRQRAGSSSGPVADVGRLMELIRRMKRWIAYSMILLLLAFIWLMSSANWKLTTFAWWSTFPSFSTKHTDSLIDRESQWLLLQTVVNAFDVGDTLNVFPQFRCVEALPRASYRLFTIGFQLALGLWLCGLISRLRLASGGVGFTLPELVDLLCDGSRSSRTRRSAAAAIGEMGPAATSALPALIDVAEREEGRVREAAIQSIAFIDPDGDFVNRIARKGAQQSAADPRCRHGGR